MEKLQQSIAKARQKRENEQQQNKAASAETNTGSVRPRSRMIIDGRTRPGADHWQALAKISPDVAQLERNRVVTLNAGPAATSFDVLRTKILLQMRENDWTRLAITSPHPACGKTTTACNLAMGMTRQPDLRAMLFDLDLRRPGIARTLGHTPAHSIPEMLENQIEFSNQAVRVGDNLAISMARAPMRDPTSLLLEQATADKLDEIEDRYKPDLMIFDLPPLLTGDDTRAFLKNVDCALLVLRAEETKSTQVDASEKEIAKYTNVLGMVLNSCRHTDDTQTYGGYY